MGKRKYKSTTDENVSENKRAKSTSRKSKTRNQQPITAQTTESIDEFYTADLRVKFAEEPTVLKRRATVTADIEDIGNGFI